MDEKWLQQIVETLLEAGIHEFTVAAGKRNAPLVEMLDRYKQIKKWRHFEERSAAFFSLARIRNKGVPVAVVVTSGTAVGELLPACMEAYYSRVPLVLITADRPRRYRGTGAPQSAEQKNIFGCYTPLAIDIEEGGPLDLRQWDQSSPLQINLCFEEPTKLKETAPILQNVRERKTVVPSLQEEDKRKIREFIQLSKNIFVIVSTLREEVREKVIQFLLELNAPLYLEAVSGLREERRLSPLAIRNVDNLFSDAKQFSYPLTHILRIGGVPTLRAWRDIETEKLEKNVLSLTEEGFSGLVGSTAVRMNLHQLDPSWIQKKEKQDLSDWREFDLIKTSAKEKLFSQYPQSEPALIYKLSKEIKKEDRLYLGNSLPIRIWDMVAHIDATSDVWATRGLNGIDGQISSSLGLAIPSKKMWGIFGDLTTFYDLVAPWIIEQMEEFSFRLVVVNNGGGKIFKRVGLSDSFFNCHHYQFEAFAKQWGFSYSNELSNFSSKKMLIELFPDEKETDLFYKEVEQLPNNLNHVNR